LGATGLAGLLVVGQGLRPSFAVIAALAVLAAPTAALVTRPPRRHRWPPVVLVLLLVGAVLVLQAEPATGAGRIDASDGYLATSVLFGMLLVSEVWMLRSRPAYSGEAHDRGTGIVIAASLPVAFGTAVATAAFGLGPSIGNRSWPLFVVGVTLALSGLALRLWAVAVMGPMFQPRLVVQEDHRVVSDGPYRLIRHPSYAGPVLLFAGIGLVLDRWSALLLCVLLPVAAYAWRIAVEERVLLAGLGTPYKEYAETTWRVAPGFW
jgi:protein-S-isoprenylcysteine O-methyltransferase